MKKTPLLLTSLCYNIHERQADDKRISKKLSGRTEFAAKTARCRRDLLFFCLFGEVQEGWLCSEFRAEGFLGMRL
ncbi:hypothetical protein CLOM621_06065 [Clostridium sp. M62/1]|nr:hypothetical protein CLOM621_06065 [Clostridium sp. M62/1]